jgi:hypothetical protein
MHQHRVPRSELPQRLQRRQRRRPIENEPERLLIRPSRRHPSNLIGRHHHVLRKRPRPRPDHPLPHQRLVDTVAHGNDLPRPFKPSHIRHPRPVVIRPARLHHIRKVHPRSPHLHQHLPPPRHRHLRLLDPHLPRPRQPPLHQRPHTLTPYSTHIKLRPPSYNTPPPPALSPKGDTSRQPRRQPRPSTRKATPRDSHAAGPLGPPDITASLPQDPWGRGVLLVDPGAQDSPASLTADPNRHIATAVKPVAHTPPATVATSPTSQPRPAPDPGAQPRGRGLAHRGEGLPTEIPSGQPPI